MARGNPNMRSGEPSLNPAGRALTKAAKRASGSDGVIAYGGYLATGEQNAALTGTQKWLAYANAYQYPAVAIAMLLRSALIAGIKWTATPNPAGGKDADRGVEIVEAGLLSARLATPWARVARKAAMSWASGFSIHAASLGRRRDGLVVYTDIGHRPPHTIEQWHRRTPRDPWDSVEQRVADGTTYRIPLSECLYIANDTLSDSPEGMGVLRLVVERLRRITQYETLEGSELFSSMGGTAIARVPLEEINAAAPSGTSDEIAAYKSGVTRNITNIVSKRIKTPEAIQYAVLSSETYQGADPNTISGVKKWDIEIIKAEPQGLAEIRKIIADLHLDVARVLGVEFVFIGGNDSAGSLGMHEDKTTLFAETLDGDVQSIAHAADDQLVRRLIAANGLDPDTAAPYLTPSSVKRADVERTCRALGLLQMAQLPPGHPARESIFERLNLPWQDEIAEMGDLMAPRRRGPIPEDAEDVEDVEDIT